MKYILRSKLGSFTSFTTFWIRLLKIFCLSVSVTATKLESISWIIDSPVTAYSTDFLNLTFSTSLFWQKVCCFHLLAVPYRIYLSAPSENFLFLLLFWPSYLIELLLLWPATFLVCRVSSLPCFWSATLSICHVLDPEICVLELYSPETFSTLKLYCPETVLTQKFFTSEIFSLWLFFCFFIFLVFQSFLIRSKRLARKLTIGSKDIDTINCLLSHLQVNCIFKRQK